MNEHFNYEYTHHIPMTTFKRLVGLILRFTKSVTKNILLLTVTLHITERIISRKYVTHMTNLGFKPRCVGFITKNLSHRSNNQL
jgi:hypothetical protein